MQIPPIDRPYKFIPAYKSQWWCRLERPLLPILLRKRFQVERFHFVGAERLRESIDARKGALLASMHSRNSDPPTIGMLSLHLNHYFYFAASFHLFTKSRFEAFQMNRLGGFSVLREGTDLEAIRQSVEILASADRPLVIFPEGTFYRRNEQLGPLQDGVAFIARQAAKKKQQPIVVHPLITRYWFLEDPRPAVEQRLQILESKLLWGRQGGSPAERVLRLTNAYLSIKEIEYLGSSRSDSLNERMQSLAEHLLIRLETKHRLQKRASTLMERVRILRQLCYKSAMNPQTTPELKEEFREELYQLAFTQQLFAHAPEYLYERPSLDRVAEAIQRLEEDLWEVERPVARMGATIGVGPALAIDDFPPPKRGDGVVDPFMKELDGQMRGLLAELLEEGPPREWNAPDSWRAEPMGAPAPIRFSGNGVHRPSAASPRIESFADGR